MASVHSLSVYFCTTNSGHQHSTEWEAENCSTMHEALLEAARCLSVGKYDPAENWRQVFVAEFEAR